MGKRTNRWFGVGLILGAWLLSGASARADSYYVEDPAITGGYQDEATAFYELIRVAVMRQGSNQVIEEPEKADYILRPKLLKLGSAFSVAIEKREDGRTVFASHHKANSIENLDEVTARLVRAVIDEVPLKDDVRVGDVTEEEVDKGVRRKGVVNRTYVGFGPSFVSDNIDPDAGVLLSLSFGYGWDLNTALLKFFADFVFAGEAPASVGGGGLEGQYFFSDRSNTPFVGARAGYGYGIPTSDSPTGFGFIGGVTAGYSMFRAAKVNLEVALRLNVLTTQIDDSAPLTYGVGIGLYF